MALALADTGDFPEAIRELQVALDHDPALIDANYNVITLLGRYGRVEEAQQAIDRWSRIDATHKLLPLAKTNIMLQRGDLADGYNTITSALRTSPEDTLVANTARNASVLLGEYRNLARFIAQASDEADVAQLKALELVGMGDRKALSAYVSATPALHVTPRRGLRDYSYMLMIARDPGAVRDYFDLQLSAPGALVMGLDACICSPIGVAWALKDTAHPSLESVMREWRKLARHKCLAVRQGVRLVAFQWRLRVDEWRRQGRARILHQGRRSRPSGRRPASGPSADAADNTRLQGTAGSHPKTDKRRTRQAGLACSELEYIFRWRLSSA